MGDREKVLLCDLWNSLVCVCKLLGLQLTECGGTTVEWVRAAFSCLRVSADFMHCAGSEVLATSWLRFQACRDVALCRWVIGC